MSTVRFLHIPMNDNAADNSVGTLGTSELGGGQLFKVTGSNPALHTSADTQDVFVDEGDPTTWHTSNAFDFTEPGVGLGHVVYAGTAATWKEALRNSWGISFFVRPNDGIPAIGQYLFGKDDRNVNGDDTFFRCALTTAGQIDFTFQPVDSAGASGGFVNARSENAVFPNGATSWTHVFIAGNKYAVGPGGVKLYINGAEPSYAAARRGDTFAISQAEWGAWGRSVNDAGFPVVIGNRRTTYSDDSERYTQGLQGKISNFAVWYYPNDPPPGQAFVDWLYNNGAGRDDPFARVTLADRYRRPRYRFDASELYPRRATI